MIGAGGLNKVTNDPMAHLLIDTSMEPSLAKDSIKAHVFLNPALGHLVLFSSDENLEDIGASNSPNHQQVLYFH